MVKPCLTFLNLKKKQWIVCLNESVVEEVKIGVGQSALREDGASIDLQLQLSKYPTDNQLTVERLIKAYRYAIQQLAIQFPYLKPKIPR